MVSKKSCGCKGSKRCNHCLKDCDHPKVFINKVESAGHSKRVFKLHERDDCQCQKKHKCHDEVCVREKCTCEHHTKVTCTCCRCVKHQSPCSTCEKEICICEHVEKHECRVEECKCECDGCKRHTIIPDCEDLYEDKCEVRPKHCPEEIKGFDFCRKKEEMKCFKHCAPISQPCDCHSYNHFTSRANLEFSGLVVVKNTGNPTSGCSMKVCVTDRCGTELVATVNPGSSVPIFVDGLISLDISCFKNVSDVPGTGICTGEVIFDMEYCTIKYIAHPHQDECC